MIYRFRLVSSEDEDFFRDFEIKSNQTFKDFHKTIQEELKYDETQMASFFICGDNWEKEIEITMFDMDGLSDGAMASITMDKAIIEQLVLEVKQKIIYVFDFFNERSFYIILAEKKIEQKGVVYPFCIERSGKAPIQIDINIDFLINDADINDTFDED